MKALFAGLALLWPATLSAQTQNCASHADVMARLATGYGETRQAIAMSNGTVMEIYANLQSGSWTITLSSPDGNTCLVAAGQGYEALVEELPAPGEEM